MAWSMIRGRESRSFWRWARMRAGEASTWAGLAMIAVVMGSDPMAAHGLAQAVSLIIGGGLVGAGPVPAGAVQAGPVPAARSDDGRVS